MYCIFCNFRCKIYSGLPAQCTLKVDPADPCCRLPDCSGIGTGGLNLTPLYGTSNGSATPPPNQFVVPVGTHNIISGSNWNKPGTTFGEYQGGSGGI